MSMLVRRATARAGATRALDLEVVDVHGFGPMGAAVTAVRNGEGNLQLTQWNVAGDGANIERVKDAIASAVSEVATIVVQYHVVTAVVNGTGHLEVNAWSPELLRRGVAFCERASQIVICPFLDDYSSDFFAAAYRDAKGALKVEVWSLSATGMPALRGAAYAGNVSEVALASLGYGTGARYRLISAVKNAVGELELVQWSVSDDGTTIKQLGSTTAGGASQISLRVLGDLVFTSLRNGAGNLEIISWRAHSNGTIDRLDTAHAGSACAVSSTLSFDASGAQFLTTAVHNGSDEVELIDWRVQPSGVLQWSSSAGVNGASRARIRSAWNSQNPGAVNPSPRTVLITAMCNGASELELISWTRE